MALQIDATQDCPGVLFDPESGIFKIEGKSLPENAPRFYQPLRDWLSEYVANPNPTTDFIFDLEYYNSSSARQLIELMFVLERIPDSGESIRICWFHDAADDLMRDRGEEMKHLLKIPFEILPR